MNTTATAPAAYDHHITVEVLKLAKDFPQLGLSFGYIGSFSAQPGDHRGWRVFTRQTDPIGSAICWGDFDTVQLADMYDRIKAGMLREFCQSLANNQTAS